MAKRTASLATIKLKPADPFSLIRLLARSQPDPRKAVAELVQNSLDAGATHVTVRRHRLRGTPCISIHDDGAGILPDLDREAALRHLATHVGHSRKAGLEPAERARQVIAGKYGVGLLGFWSIGRTLELRTRVAGGALLGLRMYEDKADANVVELPRSLDARATFTEAVVIDMHPPAQRALTGRRLADYLASELRGQLLTRGVELLVHDDMARGTSQKSFRVVPKRFVGERLDVPGELDVPGFPPIRIELYASRDEAAVQIACAGTTVADDIAQLEALGLAVAPWTLRGLAGLIDFAGFNVPPGTRRGVMPDRAAAAFVDAMERLAPLVTTELDRFDARRSLAAPRDVVRDLKRALRGFGARLPHYDLPRIGVAGGDVEEERAGETLEEPTSTPPPDQERPAQLFPPGPLAAVTLSPAVIEIMPGTERRVTAHARDASARAVEATFDWSVSDAAFEIRGAGARPVLVASADVHIGGESVLSVTAQAAGGLSATANAVVRVVETNRRSSDPGIPEPKLVSDPIGSWRSRMAGEEWQVNDAHDDYRALCGDPRARLRYFVALLGKEIVLRTAPTGENGRILDALVEILAHAERNLSVIRERAQ